MLAALGPSLREENSGFNGLSEANFIRQDGASGEWRPEGKESGFYLMGIEVYLRVRQGRREAVDRRRTGPFGEFMGEVPGVVGGKVHWFGKRYQNNALQLGQP